MVVVMKNLLFVIMVLIFFEVFFFFVKCFLLFDYFIRGWIGWNIVIFWKKVVFKVIGLENLIEYDECYV